MYVGALTFEKKDDEEEYTLEAANTGDGRLVFDAENEELFPEYYHKDHLGNIRLTFTDRNKDKKVELLGPTAEVGQVMDFYPFGLQQKGGGVFGDVAGTNSRENYNGKELIGEVGLIDYGARWYDAASGRWGQVDPLADKYVPISSYSYVGNMPVNALDPDGKKIILINRRYTSLRNIAFISTFHAGRSLLNRLISSENNYKIRVTNTTSNTHYYDRAEWNWSTFSTIPARSVLAVGTSWYSSIEKGSRKSQYILYHELGHAWQHETGERIRDHKEMELSNVPRVNFMRAIYGESKMRTSYAKYGLKFKKAPSFYNSAGLKVSDFTELDYVDTERGQVFGFSYNYTNKDGTVEKRFGAVTSSQNGEVAIKGHVQLNNREAYDLLINLIRNYKSNEN
ncbi:RHS repeat domain-containing protein [Neolewinella agarilytica]|uniref:RHS repeat-associated core domain-containing protein n=1 Tax=Neolewinella agarilytica TaxID=478744 RepID=A0A1H9IIH3_9BACT|nr:RHS repeat-associated core domain-containing protein [Neolewinella agarilytica]SEQ74511.1 RHS repeat-associated core domain-containing protein [Neolewinella agarilytica]